MVPFVTSHVNFPYIYEALACLGVVYLAFIAAYRPYNSTLDNVVICSNEFIVICTASWIFMKGFSFYNEDIEYIIEMTMIALLFLTVLLSAIRIVFGFREHFCPKEAKLEANK